MNTNSVMMENLPNSLVNQITKLSVSDNTTRRIKLDLSECLDQNLKELQDAISAYLRNKGKQLSFAYFSDINNHINPTLNLIGRTTPDRAKSHSGNDLLSLDEILAK